MLSVIRPSIAVALLGLATSCTYSNPCFVKNATSSAVALEFQGMRYQIAPGRSVKVRGLIFGPFSIVSAGVAQHFDYREQSIEHPHLYICGIRSIVNFEVRGKELALVPCKPSDPIVLLIEGIPREDQNDAKQLDATGRQA